MGVSAARTAEDDGAQLEVGPCRGMTPPPKVYTVRIPKGPRVKLAYRDVTSCPSAAARLEERHHPGERVAPPSVGEDRGPAWFGGISMGIWGLGQW